MVYYTILHPQVGELLLVKNEGVLTGLYFTNYKKCPRIETSWIKDESQFQDVTEQLTDYFNGKRKEFNLLVLSRGTLFQKQVWGYLSTIPYGTTVTYKDIAIALDRPNAMRAVGTAVGSNPLCIIGPCHRVLASGGGIGGYAGGIEAKRLLLAIEHI